MSPPAKHIWTWPNGPSDPAQCAVCGIDPNTLGTGNDPCPGKALGPFGGLFDLPEEPKTPVTPPESPTCLRCGRELSAYLDVYYGRDPVEAACCKECRR